MRLTIALFAALGLLSSAAFAGEESGFYAGAGVGQANLQIDALDIVPGVDYKFDADETAYKVFAGWRFNKYISVELGYLDLGTLSDSVKFDTGAGIVDVDTEIDLSGFAPYVVGTLPIGIFELSAKLGYVFYDVDGKVSSDALGESDSFSDSDEDLAYGVGAGMTVFDHLNVKLEYEVIDVTDADIDAFWLTGAWRF